MFWSLGLLGWIGWVAMAWLARGALKNLNKSERLGKESVEILRRAEVLHDETQRLVNSLGVPE